MKRKLFTKVLLTLALFFGLSGIANAQDLKRDSPEIVKLAKEDLRVFSNSISLSAEQNDKILEVFLDKNFTFCNQNNLSVGRKNLIIDNYLFRINLILSKSDNSNEALLSDSVLLKKVELLKAAENKLIVK